MSAKEQWDRLSPPEWEAFAQSWIAELRGEQPDSGKDVGESVVMMNFTARPEHQWRFILAAVEHASEEQLGAIAAGPVEHLLGWHGDRYIEEVERCAESDPKFARMLSGVWKYTMSEEAWARIEALKARFPAEPPDGSS